MQALAALWLQYNCFYHICVHYNQKHNMENEINLDLDCTVKSIFPCNSGG